ncbi:MAG: hypothetical protein KC421_25175, partial [Anaerolineales bacterium]|nr:hypothetical protein [Anaerolineales bacterium]
MSALQLAVTVIMAGCLFWLGLYLIGRNYRRLMLWPAGAGLFAYSVLLTLNVLDRYAPSITIAQAISRWQIAFTLLPVLFWL